MRSIHEIVVHCSATPAGKPFTATDIDQWHRSRGWDGIGYHFVVLLDGAIQLGRPIEKPGAHVAGHNSNSIGICYIGGMNSDNTQAENTLTQRQADALELVIRGLMSHFPEARVLGHRDFPKVAKACPSFDVRRWCASRGIILVE
jgi:N-acetylmuramoyl-L-alanine amidase